MKNITTELCGRELSRSTVSRLTEDLEGQALQESFPGLIWQNAFYTRNGTGK
jgi:hypothetical protein